MDFFARQEKARRSTGRLLILYAIAVIGIIGAVHFLVAAATDRFGEGTTGFFDPNLLMLDGGLLVVILIGVGVGRVSLSGGGAAVAEMCGGRPVEPGTRDAAERRYLNVVEEMSIASGVPMPSVYVLEEEGINAFAAGHTSNDYAVAVSRGCLSQLNRDELQGVVAHEFSHILNGDMLRNIRLTAWLYGILGLALVGRILFEIAGSSSRSRDKEGKQVALAFFMLGLALFAIGWIGQFFARAIQAAISRQREHLADASAVQFTRNPDGISGALKKIAGYSVGSTISHPRASAFSHMFFASALNSLFATHPPLEERIRLLDPQFNPEIAELAEGNVARPGLASTASFAGEIPPVITQPKKIIRRPRSVKPAHLEHAAQLLAELSVPFEVAVQEPLGASAVIYSLLLSKEIAVCEAQIILLEKMATPAVIHELNRVRGSTSTLPTRSKLAVCTLATAALRRLSRKQYVAFRQCVNALVKADDSIDLFEYALGKSLCRHLAPQFEPKPLRWTVKNKLAPLLPDCVVLLSCLAHLGHAEPQAQRDAFQTGVGVLGLANDRWMLLPLAECNLAQVDAALDRIADATVALKLAILEACATTVASDGVFQEDEIGLIRAIGDALDCPIPPFVPLE